VKRRKVDDFGDAMGNANSNPILDTRLYVLEFQDAAEAECSANVIAENMWAQCDMDGNQHQLMEAIIDHKLDEHDAVQRTDGHVVVKGRKHMKKSTKEWQLCIQWKDGATTSWERLADVKESNPIEVAEHSVAQGIEEMKVNLPLCGGWTLLSRREIASSQR
jgi:hypothetical protein